MRHNIDVYYTYTKKCLFKLYIFFRLLVCFLTFYCTFWYHLCNLFNNSVLTDAVIIPFRLSKRYNIAKRRKQWTWHSLTVRVYKPWTFCVPINLWCKRLLLSIDWALKAMCVSLPLQEFSFCLRINVWNIWRKLN